MSILYYFFKRPYLPYIGRSDLDILSENPSSVNGPLIFVYSQFYYYCYYNSSTSTGSDSNFHSKYARTDRLYSLYVVVVVVV